MTFQSSYYSSCIDVTFPLPPVMSPGPRRVIRSPCANYGSSSPSAARATIHSTTAADKNVPNNCFAVRSPIKSIPQVIVRKSSGPTIKIVPLDNYPIYHCSARRQFNINGKSALNVTHFPSRIPVYQRPEKMFRSSAEPLAPVKTQLRPLSNSNSAVNASTTTKGNPVGEPLSSERVADYLRTNPSFLEHFVVDNVGADTVERWLSKCNRKLTFSKTNKSHREQTETKAANLTKWKFSVHKDKKQMLLMLMNLLANRPQTGRILWELACCIATAVGADGFVLHLADGSGALRVFNSGGDVDNEPPGNGSSNTSFDCLSGVCVTACDPGTLAAFVAKNKRTVVVANARKYDSRFPAGSDCVQEGGTHVLAAPVTQNGGAVTGVIELYRCSVEGEQKLRSFRDEDEEIVSSYLVWGGIALHYADLYHALSKQRILHQFLLDVVRSFFQDMVSMDALIGKVMTYAQKLVDADRTSLFLIDYKSGELYARIFDMGDADDDGPKTLTAQEIRFPIGTGIAGQVAVTGKVLNIPDAYSDPRFNRTVDQRTGYHTQSILCMPIFIEGQVIGVVQMVNKRHGSFTAEDEESFELFAVYCGLALHHAKLYDRIQLSEQKYRVALEVLSYHNCSTEEEVDTLQRTVYRLPVDEPDSAAPLPPPGLDEYAFSAFSVDDFEKANCSVYMFVDLFGLASFDKDSLVRFMLTVKKNYRRVPYHNWTHGFAVANTMYVLLKQSRGAFDTLEALSLFVGSLCHDLDHRGKNNKFMLDTASPLASIYTTSTMEHHHFNQTVTILQQEGHNIFSKLSSEEYKEVLGNIKHCILATDLAMFFPNREKLARLVETKQFAWSNKEHRLLVQTIAMTGADLSASSKPWDIQAETVNVIMEEFYQQGDAERRAGRTPIASMDRTKPHLKPNIQVGFITGICIPCYGLLSQLIPEARPLLDGCVTNLERWKVLDRESNEHTDHARVNGDARSQMKSADSRGQLNRASSLPVRFNPDVVG